MVSASSALLSARPCTGRQYLRVNEQARDARRSRFSSPQAGRDFLSCVSLQEHDHPDATMVGGVVWPQTSRDKPPARICPSQREIVSIISRFWHQPLWPFPDTTILTQVQTRDCASCVSSSTYLVQTHFPSATVLDTHARDDLHLLYYALNGYYRHADCTSFSAPPPND